MKYAPPDITVEQIREIGIRARSETAEALAGLQRVIGETREALKRAEAPHPNLTRIPGPGPE